MKPQTGRTNAAAFWVPTLVLSLCTQGAQPTCNMCSCRNRLRCCYLSTKVQHSVTLWTAMSCWLLSTPDTETMLVLLCGDIDEEL